ncbi:MAG: hypothetical protein HQL41_09875 [Alphaproteobacteria bacterium]|nr:hypothetical protein [Alphaproteobacteria bacterium]
MHDLIQAGRMSAEGSPGAIVRRFLDADDLAKVFDGCWIRKALDDGQSGRWMAIGVVEGRIVAVTYRDDGQKHVVRAVRKATSHEKQVYLESCPQSHRPGC